MTGGSPVFDRSIVAGLERLLARILEAQAVLLTAMRESLAPTTPPATLRRCRAALRATLRLTDLVDRRPAIYSDDDPAEGVRTRALCEQAERVYHVHGGSGAARSGDRSCLWKIGNSQSSTGVRAESFAIAAATSGKPRAVVNAVAARRSVSDHPGRGHKVAGGCIVHRARGCAIGGFESKTPYCSHGVKT